MKPNIKKLGEILQQLPELEFDLRLHVIAEKYRDELSYIWECAKSFNSKASTSKERINYFLQRLEHPYGTNETGLNSIDLLNTVNKADVQENASRYIKASEAKWLKATSGTSGRPFEVVYSDLFYLEELMLSVGKILHRAKIQKDTERDTTLLFFSDTYGRSDSIHASTVANDIITQIRITPHSTHSSIIKLANIWKKTRPMILASRPELFEVVGQSIKSGLIRLAPPPLAVISSGSPLNHNRRYEIEEVFRCPVIEVYASTEFGVVASEVLGQKGLYPIDDGIMWEIDTNGTLATSGNGELVLSSIRNSAMPLIRYNTKDRAVLSSLNQYPYLEELQGNQLREIPCWRAAPDCIFSPSILNRVMTLKGIVGYTASFERHDGVRVVLYWNENEPVESVPGFAAKLIKELLSEIQLNSVVEIKGGDSYDPALPRFQQRIQP